ncbi:SDR family NAD(P)-dependent oxidoreductase [Natrinema altunense]|uniref:Short-chain dehydrogenase/reductase SDR n=2 Tax=Natrinema altunense TaxID=222984 RepID=L9ZK96_NATA2|nr:SDR family NAD(P)-dependent oxidoreductase [Natrinema altunense]ELY86779.1 short-chain dehydrogenase/reductase SDR [Natrinema altunense JCM 12890]RZH66754.1 SDR family oxidoreductase [Natrinema altunense]
MSTDQFSVDGDVAIVTGSSSGIGKSIAERFAADGVDVVVCSREQDNVDPVAEAINEGDSPGEALAVECDVTDRDAVDALVEATVEEFGGLDVLVNNAGASFMADFDDISPNGWKTIMDINVNGTYHCTHAAAASLKDGGGSVINLASVAGQRGSPLMSPYGAAKAAVINLTTTLSYEWADDDVRVNCIAPGFVATPGVESQMGVSADNIDREEVARRIGTVEEIADVTQFLASPASSYVVGETITVQGVPQIEEDHDV